jgi:hypothetical protein
LTPHSSSPSALLPISTPFFIRTYRLHIGTVGGGQNATLDRDLISATNFPDLFNFSYPFLHAELLPVDGSNDRPYCDYVLSAASDHQSLFRSTAYFRPTAASQAGSFALAAARPDSALVSIGSNGTSFLPTAMQCRIYLPSGTSPLIKGPVTSTILPRLDCRHDGNSGAHVDVHLHVRVKFYGQGYGYNA